MPRPPHRPWRAAGSGEGKADAAGPPRVPAFRVKTTTAVLAACILAALIFGAGALMVWVWRTPTARTEIPPAEPIPTEPLRGNTAVQIGSDGAASGPKADQPGNPTASGPTRKDISDAVPSRAVPEPTAPLRLAHDATGAGRPAQGTAPPSAVSPAPTTGATTPAAPDTPSPGANGESIDAALCRLIDTAAARHGLPASFFTRLIWRESSFRPHVVSRAGAQGIAQFMPGTAKERGLADPFDPEAAIPASAALLADLKGRFGNLGLAAAAYNAGPGRVSGFLAGGGLPQETRTYVRLITGRTAEDWAALKRQGTTAPETPDTPCLVTLASLRQGGEAAQGGVNELFAPWGVQISGNYSKDLALASFRRAAARYQAVFGEAPPVIIATRMAGRGARTFYRVRLPAQTRADANALCRRLRQAGGPCVVLPN